LIRPEGRLRNEHAGDEEDEDEKGEGEFVDADGESIDVEDTEDTDEPMEDGESLFIHHLHGMGRY